MALPDPTNFHSLFAVMSAASHEPNIPSFLFRFAMNFTLIVAALFLTGLIRIGFAPVTVPAQNTHPQAISYDNTNSSDDDVAEIICVACIAEASNSKSVPTATSTTDNDTDPAILATGHEQPTPGNASQDGPMDLDGHLRNVLGDKDRKDPDRKGTGSTVNAAKDKGKKKMPDGGSETATGGICTESDYGRGTDTLDLPRLAPEVYPFLDELITEHLEWVHAECDQREEALRDFARWVKHSK
jgi:hypothetical protein